MCYMNIGFEVGRLRMSNMYNYMEKTIPKVSLPTYKFDLLF